MLNCLLNHPHLTHSNPADSPIFFPESAPPSASPIVAAQAENLGLILDSSVSLTIEMFPEFDHFSHTSEFHMDYCSALLTGLPASTFAPPSLGSSQQPEQAAYIDVNSCHSVHMSGGFPLAQNKSSCLYMASEVLPHVAPVTSLTLCARHSPGFSCSSLASLGSLDVQAHSHPRTFYLFFSLPGIFFPNESAQLAPSPSSGFCSHATF